MIAWLWLAPAHAQDEDEQKQACADAFEQAQDLRAAKKLSEARRQLAICQISCPAALIDKCDEWLAAVNAAMPSVVLRARRQNGEPVSDVRVRIDGAEPMPLPSSAVEIDPGLHTFSFERSGRAPVTVEVRVAEGGKEVPVAVELADPTPPRERAAAPMPEPLPTPSSAPPAAFWVLGATGVAALGVGAALGIVGHLHRSQALDSCMDKCSDDVVDDIRRLWIGGGVSAGAGMVLVALGFVIWAVDEAPRDDSRLRITPDGIDLRF